ncbi:hypothetical protein B296_00008089 [Ensete ventricosum]|uniref:Uncharacterized protein n=1 Tax=Ensete ventricosum TaxID=4639 RepID=A0A427AJP2_ENSVE|nr:hypothetical protein B296_00008089 [Ensete ventricosum]
MLDLLSFDSEKRMQEQWKGIARAVSGDGEGCNVAFGYHRLCDPFSTVHAVMCVGGLQRWIEGGWHGQRWQRQALVRCKRAGQ